MARAKGANAKPGDTVELADQGTGFYDGQTEFKVVRNQTATLGLKIGAKTNKALSSGRLLIVGSGKAVKEDPPQAPEDDSGFDAEFPGREVLVAEGWTLEKVRALPAETRDADLLAIKGIGPKTVEQIGELLGKE